MTVRYLLVRDEITEELANLNKLFKKIVDARGLRESNEFYTEFAAMSLQSYYTGVERILRSIAAKIDGSVPVGERWHHELLDQSTLELPGVRPAVISRSLRDDLREFLAFRHIVRNIYPFDINARKVDDLAEKLSETHGRVIDALKVFVEYLGKVGEEG